MRLGVWIALIYSFVVGVAWSAPLPPRVFDFLSRKNRYDLVERWEAIRVLSPIEFVREFAAEDKSYLSAGYFGITFRTQSERIYKFAHPIFAARKMIQLNPERTTVPMDESSLQGRRQGWLPLMRDPAIRALTVYQQYAGVQVGGASVLDELLFELVAAAQSGRAVPVLAEAVSSDGLAARRPFLPGVPLDQILESERSGTDLHRAYAMPALWEQVVREQREAEGLLFEVGITKDVLTPGNFLVQGMGAAAQLTHFDYGPVALTPEARDLYLSWGVKLPAQLFAGVIEPATVWPAFPQHILYSGVWKLSRKQAIDYARAFHRGVEDEQEALRLIAQTPVLPIHMASGLVDATVIQNCAANLQSQK